MMQKSIKAKRIIPALLFLFLFAVIIKCAWVNDDAYISFRYIKNLFEGYGLRWNITERVQAFTNPLYVFFMVPLYALTGNMYLSSIFLSVGLTMASVIVGIYPKGRRSTPLLALSLVFLSVSKSFIDYSTSGLENPLTFLILAVFYKEFLFKDSPHENKNFLILSFIAGLGALNRIDTVLFFVPPLIYCFFKQFKAKKILLGLLGFSPFIAWEAFSFIYYGSFVPNTAIAKLNNTTDFLFTIKNGWRYITSTNLYGDFITTAVIFAAILTGVFLIRQKKIKHILASLSILIYILYIIYIGGDFMVGRHLSAPFFLSAMLLSSIAYDYFTKEKFDSAKTEKTIVFACCVLLFSSTLYPLSPIFSKLKYEKSTSNVAVEVKERPLDERKYYYKDAGLSYYLANSFVNGYDPERAVYALGRRGRYMAKGTVNVEGSVGFIAYFAPAETLFIDYYGLSDALLARIPAAPNQRVGHYKRPIPKGYKKTLETGTNLIENPALKEYCDKVFIIIKGKVFSKERFDTIIKMNLGKYDYLMDEYMASDEYRQYLLEISEE